MQKLTRILLLSFCAVSLHGQSYRMLVDRPGEVPVVDAVRSAYNTFDVERDSSSHYHYPSAIHPGGGRQNILSTYIRESPGRSIGVARSADGGRSWQTGSIDNQWDGSHNRSLSLFNLGQYYMLYGNRKNEAKASDRLMLFTGGSPIQISSSYTDGEHWSAFYPANSFGGVRVSAVIRLRNGEHMALFHDNGRLLFDGFESVQSQKSVIYKMFSPDGGVTWGDPEIALKHNLYGLSDAIVFRSPIRRDRQLILICCEKESGAVYVSTSRDEGVSWTYPRKLPPFVQGDRFGIAVRRHQVMISFRDLRPALNDGSPNPTFGDLMLWNGNLNELARGNRNGLKIRIADNYPTQERFDVHDPRFSDCGYASILPTAKNRLTIVAVGRWEKDEPPFVRSFILDPVEIRRFVADHQK
jgi:hypothetical protein